MGIKSDADRCNQFGSYLGFQYKTVAFTWVKQNRKTSGYLKAWDIGHALIASKYYCLLEVNLNE